MRAVSYTAIMSLLTACSALAQMRSAAPQWEISNSLVRVTLYLPDPTRGFYRGTRFDWSGVVGNLEYAGHSYYGPWFTKTDPNVSDYIYEGSDIIAGPCSAITGPVEEFMPPLGFEEAKAGGTFVKIGVGVLRKPDNEPYSHTRLYPIVDSGKWRVTKSADSVEFTQQIHDPSSGYGYVYWKKISLVKGRPEMLIEHRLSNVGTRPIDTKVYDHNFLVLDNQPPSPAFIIRFPFEITLEPNTDKDLAEAQKHRFVFRKTLAGQDVIEAGIHGFSDSPNDYKIHIENTNVKAGMTISGDRPLARVWTWSIRSVFAIEPYIALSIDPGSQFTWRYDYEYYTLPHSSGK